jgi:hypothetical protein
MKSMKNKKQAAPKKAPPSKNTALPISEAAAAALSRLKAKHGVTRTFAIERGVIMLEQSLAGGVK